MIIAEIGRFSADARKLNLSEKDLDDIEDRVKNMLLTERESLVMFFQYGSHCRDEVHEAALALSTHTTRAYFKNR